ncbi:MAG: T9SS type A sorting domain-containing protein, partial [Candidatus Cloacimonetes bacterium]|nr:T9SS type A sorting domain-containing protein [Candidatus Cloacimonadota bacterium]
ELANSIVVDHNNYTLVTGKFNDYTVFDSDSLNTSGTGDNDIFFAKLDAGDINEIYHEYLESSEIENLACYPNPFLVDQDLMIEINFNLKQNRYVQINVYNIIGQKVRALMDQKLNNGYHTHFWDGKNENGLSVKSGVYFCGIKIGGRFVTKKLIVL